MVGSHSEPLPAAADWPAGLPIPLTRFVGRERERAELARLVMANRLVTLVGAGGVGKTRLAIEVAAAVAADFDDGVVLIDLSSVSDPALLPSVLAQALGVEERAGTGLEHRLVRVLRGQHRLLLADNCEHLRGACAELLSALLGSCPGVVVLATSRESLGVPGGVTWRVPSLTFPWPDSPPSVADLESFEAIALFLARAHAARPGLVTGPAEVADITSICFHLDGIPLALELAAARTGALGLHDLAGRLSGRFEVLARSGAGPARHQTLRASVEWSHQLLSEPEQDLFRRLAVFVGGWDLDAAEHVCALAPIAGDEVAGLLAALAEKSLVHVDHTPAGSRYRLLEVIRAFASQQLAEAGELAAVRERHADYFLALAEHAGAETSGPRLPAWVRRIDQEIGNLRAARSWCGESRDRAGAGLRLAAGIDAYWYVSGRLVEGSAWLEEALALPGGPERARAEALSGLGLLALFRGEPRRAQELLAASIGFFEGSGDQRSEVRARMNLSYSLALCGDRAGAAKACHDAEALARLVGDPWLEGAVLFRSAMAAILAGDLPQAKALAATSVALSTNSGDPRMRSFALMAMAECSIREGNGGEATAVLREALAVFEEILERWGLLRAAILLALACGALCDWARAAVLLGFIDTLSERTSGRPYPHLQAALNALDPQVAENLGPAMQAARQAGRVLGRGDHISSALWPATDHASVPGPSSGLPLTARENEIAALIADGLTNRQIGARLFIAERTVDTHVGRILTKLGCSSRAQVAAIVASTATAAGREPGPTTPAGVGGS